MAPVDVVCLCEKIDLKLAYQDAFYHEAPWINLLLPEEVKDPTQISYALAFNPAANAFSRFPSLELVICPAAGVDALLGNPSLPQSLPVTRVRLTEQARMIAAFAIWQIVGWHRELKQYEEFAAHHEWKRLDLIPPSRFPVGVVGYGLMGATLARSLESLGYPVTGFARNARNDGNIPVLSGDDGLREICQSCRAVVNLLPLTNLTGGLFDSRLFKLMRDDAIFINLGRGDHVVEADLLSALTTGRPAAAACDTFRQEPLPRDHPFWGMEQLRVTPHVAADGDQSLIASFVANEIERLKEGLPLGGLVSKQEGY